MTLLPVAEPEVWSLTLPDGVRLDADIWRPIGPGRYPVLLMRQPYGRRIASTVVYAHPAWYAARGYIVVIQDVRGTGSSTGRFQLFAAEEADGAATLAAVADVRGSTGQVGMYGFSYQGNTQLLALAGGGPLAAAAPCMVGWSLRDDWAYSASQADGGVPCLAANVGWSIQMAAITARHSHEDRLAERLTLASRALPLTEANPLLPAILEEARHLTHHHAWLDDDPRYWAAIAPAARLPAPVTVPMLHIGGWQDQMLLGTLACHAAQSGSKAPQPLVIGPWAHLPWGQRVGAVDFGPAAASAIDPLQLQFFNAALKGDGAPLPATQVFDLGLRSWRTLSAWPPTTQTLSLFPTSDGRAAASVQAGRLARDPGAGQDWMVHDPWRPVPALGGPVALPGGVQDRAALDDRADVLTYTYAADDLAGLCLAGAPALCLNLAVDQPSFDVSAVLSRVTPDGRAWTLTEGYRRCWSGTGPVTVRLRPTLATLQPGERLRLSLAAAAFPAYPVNDGTGANATATSARVITLSLSHETSRLDLPILEGQA
ncbi:MAG: CocE/NonD family hydrolase [Alphaproteobacteria bacterium]|nr:CocE/NonD family hydrolase [Alphaproteobacteria bacterium]